MSSEQTYSPREEDLLERAGMAEARLADALWRERVAEITVRELIVAHGSSDILRRRFHDRPDEHVLDPCDGRPITAGDVLYVLDRAEGRRS